MVSTAVKKARTKPEASAVSEEVLAEKIATISERIPAAQQRVSELRAEREGLVIPARVDCNATAQERIRSIDGELYALEHDLADDEAAVRNLSMQLKLAKSSRVAADWEQMRVEVRNRLTGLRAKKSVREILNLAQALGIALREAREDEAAIYQDLLTLAPRWRDVWRRLGNAHIQIAHFAAAELHEVLPIDTREVRLQLMRGLDAEEIDRTTLDEMVAQLDDLEIVA